MHVHRVLLHITFNDIHWTTKEMSRVTAFSRLLTEHSYTPVSSLYVPVKIKSTVTLVTFPSLVSIDMLVVDVLSLNDPLTLRHCTSGGG